MVSNTAKLMQALSTGPKFASELPGPLGRLADRIREVNAFNRRIGSHWRVQGKSVACGRARVMLYQLVME